MVGPSSSRDQRGLVSVVERSLAADRSREFFEVVDVGFRVILGVPHRQRPRLLLGPRRLEHASVLLEQPRQVAQALIDAHGVAVLAHGLRRVDHRALGADAGDVGGQAVPLDHRAQTVLHGLVDPVEAFVDLGREHLEQRRRGGRHRQRVAVERARHVVGAVDDRLVQLARCADRAARRAAPDRLRETDDVRRHAEDLGRTAVGQRRARLHLVVGQVRPVGVQQVFQTLQVAGLRQDHAAVHHGGLDDHAGDAVAFLGDHRANGIEVVERHDPNQVGEHLRDAEGLRHRRGVLARSHVGGVGRHRDHQRVVVTVVGALDLHDQVAARVRAHQACPLQRRFRAGVAEAPQRKVEPVGEVLADHVELLRGLGEVGAQRRLGLDRRDDLGVRVAHHHGAVAEVEVDVLVLVDVPQVVALAAIDVDRVGWGILPAGRDAPGDEPIRHGTIGDRSLPLGLEFRFLALDQGIDAVEVELDRVLH